MTEPREKGWVLVHIATDSQVVRKVIARSEAVCGTHGGLWPCMSKDDDTAAVTTSDDTKEDR